MNWKRGAGRLAHKVGFDPHKVPKMLREWPSIQRDLKTFESQRASSPLAAVFPLGKSFRIYGERADSAGTATGHYFHQDLWVAREIHRRKPLRHIDVGSRIDGFVAHVASFRPIEVVDIRSLPPVQGITFVQADIMSPTEGLTGAADSVSCLHALEHFGLGRYGDPISFDGWLQGFDGLTRILRPSGILYFSVPTGHHQRVEFNAHRVFSLPFVREFVLRDFEILRCAFVHDDGHLQEDVDPFSRDADESFRAEYGCSIWILQKKEMIRVE